MFRYTERYKDIKNELSEILQEKTTFSCFVDGLFCFEIEHEGALHEFKFLCDDAIRQGATVEELLHLKRMQYFEHSIYLKEEGKPWELGISVGWNISEELPPLNSCN